MTDVKALRALLDASRNAKTQTQRDEAHFILADALADHAPDLLALAEAVRELAPHLTHARYLNEAEASAARRVLAILDPNPTNEGA